jgi:uncharacterized protein (TIGR03083 family)
MSADDRDGRVDGRDAAEVLDVDEAWAVLGDAASETPPARLRAAVVAAALAARPAGPSAPAFSSASAALRSMADFGDVLRHVGDSNLADPALGDLDVRGLIGHVIGADRYLGATLGVLPVRSSATTPETDHRAMTQPDIDAAAGLSADRLVERWTAVAGTVSEALHSIGERELDRPARYNVVVGTLNEVLVTRTFELWTHAEDLRRALDLPVPAPDAERVSVMTATAARLVPIGVAQIAAPVPGTSIRLSLTGPGGGTWSHTFGSTGAAAGESLPSVTVVADAVDFCRMMARRLEPEALPCEVIGDRSLGELVLAGATRFAMD